MTAGCLPTFLGHGDQPLELWDTEPAPSFPLLMRQAGDTGTAELRVIVDSSGRVVPGSVRVLRAPHQLFAASIGQSVTQWTFAARRQDGKAMTDSLDVEARFSFMDDPRCPRPPSCTNRRMRIPPAQVIVHRDSLPRLVMVDVRSCPDYALSECFADGGPGTE